MYKKLCPKCNQPSFSSFETSKWKCPSCHNDLTYLKFNDAEHRKNKPKFLLIKMDPQIPTYN